MTSKVEILVSSLDYVRALSGKRLLIKLGGAALQDMSLVQSICNDIARIRSIGIQVIIVHGGGPSINEALTLNKIDWTFVEGQRVTTPKMMDIVETTLCGKINRRIVRTLNASGVPAMGISGTDDHLLKCTQKDPKLGQVGNVQEVNTDFIESILSIKPSVVPVIAPIGVDSAGNAMNINADHAASSIARFLGIKKLIFLTDQDGILDKNKKLISELGAGELEALCTNETVTGGMLAKANSILYALKNGVQDVHILNAKRPHSLIEELFTDSGAGTVCRLRGKAHA